jgi:hypothetical protein
LKRPLLVVGATVVAACLLAACLPPADPWTAPTATGVGNGHHVGVIGDSITFQAQWGSGDGTPQLTNALTGLGFSASLSAWLGADTDDLYGVVRPSQFNGFPSPNADVQIIGLGTNEHKDAVPVDRFESNLRTWIDAQPGTCFGLINVYTGATSWNLDVFGPAYNDAINRIVADHANVHLIDWNSFALAHRYLYADPTSPHPDTAAGQAAYRFFIAVGAATCAQSLDATAP